MDDSEQVAWVKLGREMCSWAAGEPGWMHEVQIKMVVPGNLGQTLDPGCGQGGDPRASWPLPVTGTEQPGQKCPQSQRCYILFLLVIEG